PTWALFADVRKVSETCLLTETAFSAAFALKVPGVKQFEGPFGSRLLNPMTYIITKVYLT
ncbi:hypothetical protein J6590_056623, partial [Homalodisca vitripennis]